MHSLRIVCAFLLASLVLPPAAPAQDRPGTRPAPGGSSGSRPTRPSGSARPSPGSTRPSPPPGGSSRPQPQPPRPSPGNRPQPQPPRPNPGNRPQPQPPRPSPGNRPNPGNRPGSGHRPAAARLTGDVQFPAVPPVLPLPPVRPRPPPSPLPQPLLVHQPRPPPHLPRRRLLPLRRHRLSHPSPLRPLRRHAPHPSRLSGRLLRRIRRRLRPPHLLHRRRPRPASVGKPATMAYFSSITAMLKSTIFWTKACRNNGRAQGMSQPRMQADQNTSGPQKSVFSFTPLALIREDPRLAVELSPDLNQTEVQT